MPKIGFDPYFDPKQNLKGILTPYIMQKMNRPKCVYSASGGCFIMRISQSFNKGFHAL